MFSNLIENQGLAISLAGISIVFSGLILIALTIELFNRVFEKKRSAVSVELPVPQSETPPVEPVHESIPEDHLIAIAAAVECYRRIHFEPLQNQITFRYGNQQGSWKTGIKHGQRATRSR